MGTVGEGFDLRGRGAGLLEDPRGLEAVVLPLVVGDLVEGAPHRRESGEGKERGARVSRLRESVEEEREKEKDRGVGNRGGENLAVRVRESRSISFLEPVNGRDEAPV